MWVGTAFPSTARRRSSMALRTARRSTSRTATSYRSRATRWRSPSTARRSHRWSSTDRSRVSSFIQRSPVTLDCGCCGIFCTWLGARVLSKRIIACLDVRDGQVVKGINFEGLRSAGDPAELARRYNVEGIDELVILDITATIEARRALADTISRVARELFIPLAVGGG